MFDAENEKFIKNEDGSLTYKLKYPAKDAEGNPLTELTFQRLKGKHIQHLSTGVTNGQLLEIAGIVSGQTKKVMTELDGVDALACAEAVSTFLS